MNGRVKDCACGLLIANDRILLGRRTADRRIYPNVWDVIGGHLEPGETLEEALIREVEEEIGVTPTAFSRLTTIAEPNPDINGNRAFYSLRHTFETQAGESRDQPAVDLVMGHSDSSMAANYRHGISDQRLQDVVNVVRSWLWPPA